MRALCRRHPQLPGPKHRVQDLAVHVELPLAGRGVADSDGTRVLVPRKPIQLVLGEPPLAAQAVHDLEVVRVAGDRTEQPVPPTGGRADVSGGHQCVEKERAVPQPAIAIVPVRTPPRNSGSEVVGAATMPPVGA
jgi:hypothetical protein